MNPRFLVCYSASYIGCFTSRDGCFCYLLAARRLRGSGRCYIGVFWWRGQRGYKYKWMWDRRKGTIFILEVTCSSLFKVTDDICPEGRGI